MQCHGGETVQYYARQKEDRSSTDKRSAYSKDNDVPPGLHVCFQSTSCEPLTCEGRRRVRRPHSREVRAHGSNLVIQGRSGMWRLITMGHSGGEAGERGVDREEQGLRRTL